MLALRKESRDKIMRDTERDTERERENMNLEGFCYWLSSSFEGKAGESSPFFSLKVTFLPVNINPLRVIGRENCGCFVCFSEVGKEKLNSVDQQKKGSGR